MRNDRLITRNIMTRGLPRRSVPLVNSTSNVAPVASFTSSVNKLDVTFTDTSTDADGTIVAWDWDFGDGTAHGTTQNPVHTYATVGDKTVTLIVTDSGGLTHSVSNTATPTIGRDGPGNWYVPITALEFAAIGLAAPDYLWTCQAASGNLASVIGTLTLTANATGHLYQQSVTGWTRKFLGTDGSTAGQSWRTTDSALDLAAGESYAVIGYVSATLPGAARTLFGVQGTTEGVRINTTTGTIRSVHGNSNFDGTVDHSGITLVRQVCWYRNGTSNVSGFVSNLDAFTGTHNESARAGSVRSIGDAAAATPAAARYGLFMIFKGANAERDFAAYLTTLRG